MSRTMIYEAYEELQAKFDANGNRIHLSTPWASIEAEFPQALAPKLVGICEGINGDGTADSEDLRDFLAVFKEHLICYVRPRHLALEPAHCSKHKSSCRYAFYDSPEHWVDGFAPEVAHGISLPLVWEFNVQEVLQRSRIQDSNLFDPVAAFRAVMRLVFLRYGAGHERRSHLLDFLETVVQRDERVFFETIKYYLRQYHHVTSTSSDCIAPAVASMPFARELVSHLAKEEHGHGSFTLASLQSLGVDNPFDLPLDPYAPALMNFLKAAAHLNPLAFACLFNVFELPGEQAGDPVGELIRRSSRPESARGIDAHFTLNKNGAHFTSGLCLVDEMQAIDEYTVLEATRMTELHLMLHEALSESIRQYGQRL